MKIEINITDRAATFEDLRATGKLTIEITAVARTGG